MLIQILLGFGKHFGAFLVLIATLHLSLHAQNDSKKETPPFDKKDVEATQKLLGLSFSTAEIDTMYPYLERNLEGYQAIQKASIDYKVLPALTFNPIPTGFEWPTDQLPLKLNLPEEVQLPENRAQLAFLTISELASLIKNQKITATELTTFFIQRIKSYDPLLKATITLTDSLALVQAKKVDAEIAAGNYKGLLHGIPFGIKDIIAVPGYKTTWGAEPYKNQVINEKAVVVQKLEEAGGILVAKLTSGALARGDVWFGGMTRNPWDTLQGASGSSAGSASATAAGLVPYAIGTETLGSIISPSSRCGVTGLRPTYDRVSRKGVMSLSWSMDKVGPICRNAQDCAIVFDYLREQKSLYDGASLPFNFDVNRKIQSLRVAYLHSPIMKDTSLAGENGRAAIKVLKESGLKMDTVLLPETYSYPVFDPILRTEAAAFFEPLILSNGDELMVEQHRRSRANSLRQAYFVPATAYLQANRLRKLLIESMHQLMKNYDVLIVPTRGTNQSLITNLTGHPALTVPTGFDDKGRPTSIVLIGQLYREGPMLELGYFFQKQTTFDEQYPPLFIK